MTEVLFQMLICNFYTEHSEECEVVKFAKATSTDGEQPITSGMLSFMNVCPFVSFGIDQRQFLYVPNIILVKKLIVAVINFATCTQNIAVLAEF